jgi:hypothetical protein
MGTPREWIAILAAAALWAVSMPIFFYLQSFLPNRRFNSIRKQTVLLRAHPLAFILWGLAGVDWGLWFLFRSRVFHGGLLVILMMATAGALGTIFLSNRLALPKSN